MSAMDELAAPRRVSIVAGEVAKLPAFLRRDFLVAWSYRASFFSNIAAMLFQIGMFYFVGLMVKPDALPTFGGTRPSYLAFVVVGIAVTTFLALGAGRVAAVVRGEQLMGTLEPLLMTPTSTATIQIGSVAYYFVYVPVQTLFFLLAVGLAFDLGLDMTGLLPAAAIILLLIPFVWGLGLASAAAVMTFKSAGAGLGLGATVLTLTSGAYFPLELLPAWFTPIAELNPLAIAIDGAREALIGGRGWTSTASDLALLAPFSVLGLAGGAFAFRVALRRERRRGTLGLY